MKFVRYIIFLFLAVLILFPLKSFWGEYLKINGILYDILWMLLAGIFFNICNYIFEKLRNLNF